MSIHLHKEIKKTEKRLLTLSAMVEEAVRDSVKAFIHNDVELAQKIIDNDHLIDAQEIDVEEECLKTLALHQPVAIDLRFIVAVLKINSDLERIGDHAVSIARRAKMISELTDKDSSSPFDFEEQIDLSSKMVKQAIDALINHDVEMAYSILENESATLQFKEKKFEEFIRISQEHPEHLELNAAYMFVSRYLERIAEHALNIAEDVVYMINGEIIRHQG